MLARRRADEPALERVLLARGGPAVRAVQDRAARARQAARAPVVARQGDDMTPGGPYFSLGPAAPPYFRPGKTRSVPPTWRRTPVDVASRPRFIPMSSHHRVLRTELESTLLLCSTHAILEAECGS
jgi:hypothetical protein